MNTDEYREHADRCRAAAERATEPIRGDFLAAASVWDMLAGQWEWLKHFSPEAAKSRGRGREPSEDFYPRD